MTNESNSTTTALALRWVTAFYPLSTDHYPLGGLKSLPIKKMPVAYCDSRTCRDEIRNPMILKNVVKGGRGGEGMLMKQTVSAPCQEDVKVLTSYNELLSTVILNKIKFTIDKFN